MILIIYYRFYTILIALKTSLIMNFIYFINFNLFVFLCFEIFHHFIYQNLFFNDFKLIIFISFIYYFYYEF